METLEVLASITRVSPTSGAPQQSSDVDARAWIAKRPGGESAGPGELFFSDICAAV
jgi:hypothetical protein